MTDIYQDYVDRIDTLEAEIKRLRDDNTTNRQRVRIEQLEADNKRLNKLEAELAGVRAGTHVITPLIMTCLVTNKPSRPRTARDDYSCQCKNCKSFRAMITASQMNGETDD